ncbi:ATP-binding protein [Flavilitoribacter nigricans]|uniref:histidine kinase n=1 Tax=Flavilitoribacter nigricans (strain ATCC 23147 / DSM 23189 / NBRC 102662 / NCIMB 1420 / SS-2) TaxID=1122177 RepID=A0A2D0NJ90_FLAN2|nr:ATP-binding protein [Flavilitoribacter nigricans]PHN08561.1 hypothetical protein CRP01_01220 [Flavilitoribacter nigricans DSM 23189 = NBRC 102662]
MYIWVRCIIIGIALCLFQVMGIGQEEELCDNEVAEALFDRKDYRAAIEAYECSLEYSTDTTCQAESYYRIGKAFCRLSNYRTAILNHQWALELLDREKDPKARAKNYSGIADANSKLGNFEEAYYYESKALQIAEINNDKKSITRSVYQLGNYAHSIEDYSRALENYMRVRTLLGTDTVTRQYGTTLGAIGSAYIGLYQLEKAIKFLEQSAELGIELKDSTILFYALGNLGEAHAESGNVELAVSYIHAAIEGKEAFGDQNGVVDSKLELGQLLMAQKRYGRAETLFTEALMEANEIGAKVKVLECYQALKSLFSENGQYEKAFYFLDRYTTLKEEMLGEKTRELIEEHNIIYQTSEKEAEIKRLKDIQVQRDENDRLKTMIMISVVLLITGLIIAGYRINKDLSRKNATLAEIGDQLKRKNIELEHFAHIASHDLKEPLRTISSFTSLLGRKYVDNLDNKAQEYMGFIHKSVANMYTLLDDLLNYARADRPKSEATRVKSNQLLDVALGNLNAQIEKKDASIIVQEESLPELEIVPSQLVQLFQNLIGNALKFSNGKKPEVQVNCRELSENYYCFSVKDNGIGIAPADQQKIFEMFSRLHHEEAYWGTGIGLATCQKIVDLYGGKIWVESELGKGATFYFTLPDARNEKSRTV